MNKRNDQRSEIFDKYCFETFSTCSSFKSWNVPSGKRSTYLLPFNSFIIPAGIKRRAKPSTLIWMGSRIPLRLQVHPRRRTLTFSRAVLICYKPSLYHHVISLLLNDFSKAQRDHHPRGKTLSSSLQVQLCLGGPIG